MTAAAAVRRGLVGGAVGTTVLNLVTYLDMAVRGRPASELPRRTVEQGLRRLDIGAGGTREDRMRRETAAGALAGIGAGLGVGVGVASSRSLGLRLSPLSGGALTTALAMAATDGPATALGVTRPSTWTAQEWAADVLPHLAYGVVTHQVVRGLEKREPGLVPASRPSARLVGRSFLLGVAAGCRSSMGLAGAALITPVSRAGTLARGVAVVAVAAELVADKHPQAPSRLDRTGMGARLASATVGATALAARDNAVCDLPVAAGAVGAALGAVAGLAWREAGLMGPLRAALLEDLGALALTMAVSHGPSVRG